MFLFQIFILFLYLIPNYSTPPYFYPISLFHGWYNEAFLYGNIDKYGDKVLDWHYSEYLGDINSTNEKMMKISVVTQTILLNESAKLHSRKSTKQRSAQLTKFYRKENNYNLCILLMVRQKLSDSLVPHGVKLFEERNLPGCDPKSPQLNRQMCERYAHIIDEMNFLMFLRRMKTGEFQQIIKKISKSNAKLGKIKEKFYNLFGIATAEILRYVFPEFNYVFAFDQSEFSEINEFYTNYFNDSLLISKWRSKQYIEYSLIIKDKNFNDEEKIIWSEMTKYYWYGDTEMQIQYVKSKELTDKEITENISLNPIANTTVPLFDINFNGIDMDIMIAPIARDEVSDNWNFNLNSDENLINKNSELIDKLINEMLIDGNKLFTKSIVMLTGYRAAFRQMFVLLDKSKREIFKDLLKAIKHWAKQKQIYSNMFGYLSGTILSIMANKICLLYPSGSLSFLFHKFFVIFSKWDWPKPLLLEPLSTKEDLEKLGRIKLHLNSWQIKDIEIEGNLMPVISTKYPELNSAKNINENGLKIIIKEMNKSLQQFNYLNSKNFNKMDKFWKENIFGELNYKKYFKYFLIITCSLNSEEENGDSLLGFMKSKIRKAMEIWSKEKEFTVHLENKTVETNLKENLLEYRILSGYEEKGRCRVDEDENPRQCSIWVVGINFSNKIDNWEVAKRLINIVYVRFQWYTKNEVKIQTIPVQSKNLQEKINSIFEATNEIIKKPLFVLPENKDKKINLNNSNFNSIPKRLKVEEEKDFVYFKFNPFETKDDEKCTNLEEGKNIEKSESKLRRQNKGVVISP